MDGITLGLAGFAGAGKDAVASILQDYGYLRVAFADPLKSMVRDIDPWLVTEDGPTRLSSILLHGGWAAVKAHPDGRRYLQDAGLAVRQLDPDFWVRTALDRPHHAPSDDLVVTDVRFPNELQAIRARGGLVALVERPGVGRTSGHVSEQLAEDLHEGRELADLTIYNPGTDLGELRRTVERTVLPTVAHLSPRQMMFS